MKGENDNNNWLNSVDMREFAHRFLWGIAVFVLIVAVFVLLGVVLDGCNVVRRSLDILAPHAKSLRLMILLCAMWLLLCIPGVTNLISELIRKMTKLEVGGVALQFEQGTFDCEVDEGRFGQDAEPYQKAWSVSQRKHHGIEHEVLRRHCQRLDAEIKLSPARLKDGHQQFDALLLKGRDVILVEVKERPDGVLPPSMTNEIVCRFEETMLKIESSERDHFSLDILVAVGSKTSPSSRSPFEPVFNNGNMVGRVFYYPVNFDA